ncbi:pilus assembly protein [Serratia proteamaculans]|uniref:fimbrial protein n=1 Tax=Serratia proteamaculans TaxID=28151 RepID=UPI001076636B|nr:fimbrial protein [Serratia proteamaculans]TFZ52681.1 pilus assembly protein [Serratia proteamaculans]
MRYTTFAGVALLLITTQSVCAAGNPVQVNLHGTLIEPPPCTINNGNVIDVDFGDRVGTSGVDGNSYKQAVNYQITCEDNPQNAPWVLGLTVLGTSTDFDDAAIATSIAGTTNPDFGIKLLIGGDNFTLNQRVDISAGNKVLEAVPVKRAGSTLPEGVFDAYATLLADYQ